MANINKRVISIVVAVICACALIAVIAVGCVLQKQNEWKHRYELLSSEGNTYVVAEVSKVESEYSHVLIKNIKSKLVENDDDFYKSIVYYEVTLYFYNSDENNGQEQKAYYSYDHSADKDKVAVIEANAFNALEADATFEYVINTLIDLQ